MENRFSRFIPAAMVIAERALFMVASVIAVCIVAPFNPLMPATHLDASWMQVLGYAAANGWSFGRDISFTYGPLGFVQSQAYWPRLYPATFSYWVAIALVASRLAFLLPSVLPEAWLARAGLALLIGVGTVYTGGEVYECVAVMALVAALRTRLSAFEGALVCAMLGVAGLVKFTGFVVGMITAATMDLLLGLERRRLSVIHVGAFVATYLVFWLLVRQPLADLPSYFVRSIHVVAGWAWAFAIPGHGWEALGAWALAAATVVLAWRTAASTSRMRQAVYTTAVAALTLLALKHGLTRHDTHASIFFFFAATAIIAQSSALTRPTKYVGVMVTTSLAFVLVTIGLHWEQFPTDAFRVLAWRVLSVPGQIAALGHNPDLFEQRFQQVQAEIAQAQPLPNLPGTVDVYPQDQYVVLAHALSYQPRPVFQSSLAYDAFLLELNRDHLRSSRAADHILFAVQPVDGRLPAFDDSLSWPDLLSRYQLRSVQGPYAVLDRRAQALPVQVQSAGATASDGWIRIPEVPGALTYARLTVQLAATARLRGWFYKPARLWLEVRRDPNRAPARYRFVPAIANSGFLAAPVVLNVEDFIALNCVGTVSRGVQQPLEYRVTDDSGSSLPLTAQFVHYRIGSSASDDSEDSRACHSMHNETPGRGKVRNDRETAGPETAQLTVP